MNQLILDFPAAPPSFDTFLGQGNRELLQVLRGQREPFVCVGAGRGRQKPFAPSLGGAGRSGRIARTLPECRQ